MNKIPKPPLWALIIGSLGLCLGAFGTLAGAQDIALPYLIAIQKQSAATIFESLPGPVNPGVESTAPVLGADWSGKLESLLSAPEWHPRYALAMGIARTVLGVALMLASLLLILVWPGADFFFMLALGLSAARNLTALVIGVAVGSVFSYWAAASGIIGFLFDIIMVVSCVISNRSAYQSP